MKTLDHGVLHDNGARKWVQGATCLAFVGAVVTALAWFGYDSQRQRTLIVTADEPTQVEVFVRGDHARPLATFTAPTPVGLRLPAGDYDLRISGRGRVGDVLTVDLDTDQDVVQVSASLDHWRHCEPFVETRFLAPVDLGSSRGLVAFTPEGLRLLEIGPHEPARDASQAPMTNQRPPVRNSLAVRWTLDLRDPAASGLPLGFHWEKTWNWLGDLPEDRELELYQPKIHDRFVDLNRDGTGDVVCTGSCQAWVLAISGATGDVLWCAARGADVDDPDVARSLFGTEASSALLGRPETIDDIDGDETVDFLATLIDRRPRLAAPGPEKRWIEAISGATGKAIWRYAIPDAWWNEHERPEYPVNWDYTRNLGGAFHSRLSVSDSTELSPTVARRVAWGSQDAVGFVAGARVALLDLRTGTPLQPAYDLGSWPERHVEWGDFDGDGFADVACRQKIAGAQGAAATERLAAQSPRLGRRLWESGELRAGWEPYNLLPAPAEPLVADVTGDGIDDVVVLEIESSRSYTDDETSAWSLYDGASGRRAWRRPLRHLSTDVPLGQTLVGPDIDGDGRRELFVATVARDSFSPRVHALSGADGRDVWRATGPPCVPPSGAQSFQRSVASVVGMRWRQGGVDGWPQLIVRCQAEDTGGKWFSSVTCFSAGAGAVAQIGQAIHGFLAVDLNVDGVDELLTYRESTGDATRGTWEVAQGTTSVRWRRRQDDSWSVIPDLNGDGCQDVLVEPQKESLRAYDGRTGARLWSRSYVDDDDDQGPNVPRRLRRVPFAENQWTSPAVRLTPGHTLFARRRPLLAARQGEDHDHDGDGVPDLVRFFFDVRPTYWLVSGRTGRASFLMQRPPGSEIELLGAVDLDGDERYEWLVQERAGLNTNLVAWSTSLQRRLWTHAAVEDLPGGAIVHCDGDSIADFVFIEKAGEAGEVTWCAVSGRTGESLWRATLDGGAIVGASGTRDLSFGISFPADEGSPGNLLLATPWTWRDGLSRSLVSCVELSSGAICWQRVAEGLPSIGDPWRVAENRPLVLRRKGMFGAWVLPFPRSIRNLEVVDAAGRGNRIDLPIGSSRRDVRIPQYAVVDADQDGVDELVVLTEDELQWYELDTLLGQGEVRPTRTRRLPANQEFQESYAGPTGADAYWARRGATQLTAFAMHDGVPHWHVAVPSDLQDVLVNRLGAVGNAAWQLIRCLESTEETRAPHMLFAHGHDSLSVRQASLAPSVNQRAELSAPPGAPGRASRMTPADARIVSRTWEGWGVDRAAPPPRPGRDERFARPLPWGEKERWRMQLDDELPSRHPLRYVRPIARRWLLSLALVVAPIAFVARSIRRRQFSLRQLFVAPVLVGAALTFGAWSADRFDRDAWFDDLFRTDDWAESFAWLAPYWATRWGLAVRYAPPTALTLLAATWLASGRRRRIGWLAGALAVVAATTAVTLVAFDVRREPLVEGEFYAWREWYLLGWDAVFATSWCAVAAWPLAMVAAVARRRGTRDDLKSG